MIQIPKDKAVAYLDKGSIRLYSSRIGSIVSAQFPTNIISDIELIDDEMFGVFMKAFLEQHKITPHQVALILSPMVVFEKKLLEQGAVARAEEIQRFNEAVPFNEVASKQYTTDGVTYVADTNNELINAFKIFFKRSGWYVSTVLPLAALGKPYSAKPDIDQETMQYVIKRFDDFKQLDMSDQDDTAPMSYFRLDTNPNNQQSKKTLPVLISVFAILLGVLGFLVYSQQNAQVPVNANLTPTIFPTIVDRLNTTDKINASSAGQIHNTISIHIINSTDLNRTVASAESTLRQLGYNNISIESGQVVNGKPLVIFMKSVSSTDRLAIIQSLDKTVGAISVQDTDVASYEATITLTKP